MTEREECELLQIAGGLVVTIRLEFPSLHGKRGEERLDKLRPLITRQVRTAYELGRKHAAASQ